MDNFLYGHFHLFLVLYNIYILVKIGLYYHYYSLLHIKMDIHYYYFFLFISKGIECFSE